MVVMTSYQNYKNLCLSLYKKITEKSSAPRLLRAGQTKRWRSDCFASVRNPQEKQQRHTGTGDALAREPESPVPQEMESSSSRSPWCFPVSGEGEELASLGIGPGRTAGCQAWQV